VNLAHHHNALDELDSLDGTLNNGRMQAIVPSGYGSIGFNMTDKVFPAGSCDTHFHVFENTQKYPLIEAPSYIPMLATLDQYKKTFNHYGIDRGVLVQPSVYGKDHELLKHILKAAAPGTMRGVAVIFEDTLDREIEELHELGVRGARCNALFSGGVSARNLEIISKKIKNFGWHMQLLIDINVEPLLVDEVVKFGIPVVVDHFGHAPAPKIENGSGLARLLNAMRDGSAWVKFSGGYRISKSGAAFDSDVRILADKFMKANPDRIVWGSDWPHPGVGQKNFSAGDLFDSINKLTQPELVKKILVDNPSNLYWKN